MLIIISLFILIFSVLYVHVKLKQPSILALKLKISTTFFILIFAIYSTYISEQHFNFGFVVILCLILGLIADVFLELRFIYPKDRDRYTFCGFFSILLGLIIYCFYFISKNHLAMIEISCIFAVGGLVVFLVLSTESILKLNFGKFRIIVSVIAFILSLVIVLTLWIGLINLLLSFIFFGVGMLFVLISSFIFLQLYFGRTEKKWMIISHYLLYFCGQYILVYSINYE